MKKYTLLIFILFFFLYSCTTRYSEHFYSERQTDNAISVWTGDFSSSWEIIAFPNEHEEEFLVRAIDNAKEKIWIEIYTFTKMKSIYTALVNAKNRSVDVRVLLEWNVYGTPSINKNTADFLRKNHITVGFTDNKKYTFTHAKFWIIDNEYFMSTGNWTKSFFSKNREYIYRDHDAITRQFLEKIFQRDFSHDAFVQGSEIPDHIVISPLNAREKIENFIQTTENEVFLYVQTISDENILKSADEIKKSGKNIILCTADNEENRKAALGREEVWRFAKNPYLHAKIILKDKRSIFLWSQNFTSNALDNNREMGIILTGRVDLYKKIYSDIVSHCNM